MPAAGGRRVLLTRRSGSPGESQSNPAARRRRARLEFRVGKQFLGMVEFDGPRAARQEGSAPVEDILGWAAILALTLATLVLGGILIFVALHY
jgi:hypothetical protein